MEARDLEYFSVAADLGNLRRAAEVLNLSQPALSKSIRRLEQSAETKLIRRTPRGIELTAAGVSLLGHARRLRLSIEEIMRELKEHSQGTSGNVRIGSAPVQMRNLLIPACVQLHKSSPKVRVRLTIAANDELLPALARGELDVTLCGVPSCPPQGLVQERLHQEAFCVYAASQHPLTRKKKLSVADLAGQKWALTPPDTMARKLLQDALDSADAGPLNVVMESAALSPKVRLVAATDVLGFTPWRDLRDYAKTLGLVELPVSGLQATRIVGISYRKDAYLSPSAHRFIDIVRNLARQQRKDREA